MQSLLNQLPGAVSQGLIWGIMAIGVYITYKILDLADLTVDGTLSFGGVILVVSVTNGLPMWLSMLLAFVGGCLAGLVTGILHTKFGIPAILAGILTQLALYSIYLRVSLLYPSDMPLAERTPSPNVPVSSRNYNVLMSVGDTTKSILIGLAFCIVIIAILYWFFGTELGHSIRATGCNLAMARANGINTSKMKIIGLVLSNGLVGVSGALLAQYNGSADINMGRGAIVIGLAAVIIGEVLFSRLFKNFALKLLAAVIGSIIYYFVMQFVMWLGMDTNDLKLFSAITVAIFLGIPYWKGRIAERRVKQTAPAEPPVEGGAGNA